MSFNMEGRGAEGRGFLGSGLVGILLCDGMGGRLLGKLGQES